MSEKVPYDEWFLYYKNCEKKLKKIHKIMNSKNLKGLHKKIGESKVWDNMIDIHFLSSIRNPDELREHCENHSKEEYERKKYDTSK